MQAADWTEAGIEDYEMNSGAIFDDEDHKDRHLEFNEKTDMRKPELVIDMKFPNSRVFREALREYVMNKPVDIKFKLNKKTKIYVHCKNDYGWRLYASIVSGELTFHIKTFHSICKCGRSFQHNQVNSSYVTKKYLQDFSRNPKWEMVGVQHHVKQDISMQLSKNQVYRAKRKAREILEGDEKLQYAAMIRKTNVGSKVFIKCDCSEADGQPKFLRIYVR